MIKTMKSGGYLVTKCCEVNINDAIWEDEPIDSKDDSRLRCPKCGKKAEVKIKHSLM